ncbi:MAG: porin [Pseudomonadota bacterium]
MTEKLKQMAAAIALACSVGTVQAQTPGVTIYGVVDTGLEYLTRVDAAGNSQTRVPSLTGLVPSRLGFRGSEDLGGGLNAVFTLESGILVDSGALGQGGRLFGRQAFVGLSSREFGTLALGRMYTMTTFALQTDTMGPAIYALASLDSYLANARVDNALGYLGRFGGLTLGATYSLGRDTAGVPGVPNPGATLCPGESATDSKACRQWSALLKYDSSSWGVATSHDQLSGGPGETLGLVSSSFRDKRTIANGWIRFGDLRVNAGVVHRHRNTATDLKSNLWFVGASYPLMPRLALAAEFHRLDMKGSNNDTDLLVLRGVYELSKRTSVYAMLGIAKNSGTAARSVSSGATVGAGMNQTGVMAGISHSF